MAKWLKMWIIGCKCHGSLVLDVKVYILHNCISGGIQYWLIVKDVVAYWL
jgi:hypothetical protein